MTISENSLARSAEPGEPPDGARPLRLLIASHGHPQVAKGGGEIAAYSLYGALAAVSGCEAWFLGCRTGGPDIGARRCAVRHYSPFSKSGPIIFRLRILSISRAAATP